MRVVLLVAAVLILAGCQPATEQPRQALEMQTIEQTPPRLAAVDPPPMLGDNLPQRAIPTPPDEKSDSDVPTPEDEMKAKTNLPFTPYIAMDPVDGSKVSITAETPVHSYENQWYYFSSAANKRAFIASPEQYLKGQLARY